MYSDDKRKVRSHALSTYCVHYPQTEADLLGRLQGKPHIVQMVRHAFRDRGSGLSCLVTRPLCERTLKAAIEQGGYSKEQALRWVEGMLEAMAGLGEEGHIHGDLHVGNWVVDEGGEVWLIDFGLGRAFHPYGHKPPVIHRVIIDEGSVRTSSGMHASEGGESAAI
jgi:serine/threonine protein kinase